MKTISLFYSWLGGFALIIAAIVVLGGCKKTEFTDSPDAALAFSTDSVVFDTVFNTIGTATYYLKVYNKNKEAIKTDINLQGGAASAYRINADGQPGVNFDDVEILADDSIFIFIEVTVDPAKGELYPFVEDRLEFNTNGNLQQVKLIAWGWDAIFYYPDVFPQNGLPNYSRIAEQLNTTVTWTSEKPIVIYGYLVVDSAQTLIVEPGTQIFLHQGSGLWVYRDGELEVNGTTEAPVVFQGDRLEDFYADIPGQWDRIWINENATGHHIRNAVIKNSLIGIQAEPLPFGENTAALTVNELILENVSIRNCSSTGLYSRNYRLKGTNVEISSCGEYLFAATGSGAYKFDNCTFANNWSASSRQTPGVALTNYYETAQGLFYGPIVDDSYFRNCIFYGNSLNEFSMDFMEREAAGIELTIEQALLKGEEEEIYKYDTDYYAGEIYVNNSPGFINFQEGDLGLLETAFVRGKGIVFPTTPAADIVGNPYDISQMPLGSHAYFPE